MKLRKLQSIIKSFSITEKFIFLSFLVLFVFSLLSVLYSVNEKYLIEVPQKGGVLKEGLVGTPRFINPLLAISETDRSLVSLIYSGLMRITADGLVPDLAERFEVSEDGLEYRFWLKEGITFHDGKNITADDVIFTIIAAKNPELRSPKRSNWDGVTIEKINDQEILFKLNSPYSPFLQNMTIGILPRHIWSEIQVNEFNFSNFNIEPIGSGPYRIHNIRKDSLGIPTVYKLRSFKNFSLGEPNIKELEISFYRNQDLLIDQYNKKSIDSIYGIDPKIARGLHISGENIETFILPRIFGIFLNQSENPVLANRNVRNALQLATPKQKIINEVLFGFGKVINNPVPKHILPGISNEEEITSNNQFNQEEASRILLNAGWNKNENGILTLQKDGDSQILSITISTSNVPELTQAANIVAEAWREIGVDARIQTFESNDLNSNVIRPRRFEALLFGIIIGRDLDFYAFWHSSQRNDPGLNITGYANIDVDKLLDESRQTRDSEVLREKFIAFNSEIKNDIPAIFLYSPEFIYVIPKKVGGVNIGNLISSEERFMNIHQWYTKRERVWPIFVR